MIRLGTSIIVALSLSSGLGAVGIAERPGSARAAIADGGGTAGRQCAARPAGSRWAAERTEYVRTAVYGNTEEGWLMMVSGLAVMPDGRVLVYDGRDARIKILSGGDLSPVKEFGRKGQGPGELTVSPFHGFGAKAAVENLAAVGDSLIYIHDSRKVEIYDFDGASRGAIHDVSSGIFPPFTTRYIHALGVELLVVSDSLDRTGARPRRFQTWAVRPDGSRRLVIELPLPAPPIVGGSVFTPATQARPLWTATADCIAVADGESEWVLRYHAATGAVDTLRLPSHKVPPPTESPVPDALVAAMRSRGSSGPVSRGVVPTAVMRWSEMVADPDGHLWIRPWEPPERRRAGQVPVFRVDLSTGAVRSDTVPAFPRAFGEPGVYYAVEIDPDSDEVLITRYSLVREQR